MSDNPLPPIVSGSHIGDPPTDIVEKLERRATQLVAKEAAAEIERLRVIEAAARAFEAGLSEYCDGPERDALRAALEGEAMSLKDIRSGDEHILELEAEIEGLRAERDKLRGALEDTTYPLGEIDGLRATVSCQQAEIERLTAALREVAAGFNHDGNWCRVRARAALEGKP